MSEYSISKLFGHLMALFFVFYFLFFTFAPVSAQEASKQPAKDLPPEKNPMCWTKEACKGQWELTFDKTFQDNYWEPGGPGGVCKHMGVCLPAGTVPLSINIGGVVKSENLGDYIKTIYKWLLGVGGLIAAVLIIKGGFEWITSGGSADRVKSARGTISGAVMGLLLLIGSYFILYTVNPDLVRLRLPGVYMVRQIVLATEFCQEQTQLVAWGAGAAKPVPFEDAKYTVDPQWEKKQMEKIKDAQGWYSFYQSLQNNQNLFLKVPTCGDKYYIKDGNGQTCLGKFCAPEFKDGGVSPKVCVSPKEGSYVCEKGFLAGILKDPTPVYGASPLEQLWLGEVCEDGKVIEHKHSFGFGKEYRGKITHFGDHASSFHNEGVSFVENECPQTAGYYLIANLDDKNDVGGLLDDDYAIGCEVPTASDCSLNLARLVNINPLGQLTGANTEESDFRNGLEIEGATGVAKIKQHLIPLSEFNQGKYVEINIAPDQFQPD